MHAFPCFLPFRTIAETVVEAVPSPLTVIWDQSELFFLLAKENEFFSSMIFRPCFFFHVQADVMLST